MKKKSPPQECILFFVKYPQPGQVKTRLAVRIGPQQAAVLYRHFVRDMLTTLQATGYHIRICFSPPASRSDFSRWLGNDRDFYPQEGTDLGERLKNCFNQACEDGYEQIVVIGSDSPDIPAGMFREAFESLNDHDMVIGPTVDGGYYLLGLTKRRYNKDIFDNIPWSTSSVLAKTITRVHDRGCTIKTMPEWQDVDTIEDLGCLYRRNKNRMFEHSKTMQYLQENESFFCHSSLK